MVVGTALSVAVEARVAVAVGAGIAIADARRLLVGSAGEAGDVPTYRVGTEPDSRRPVTSNTDKTLFTIRSQSLCRVTPISI